MRSCRQGSRNAVRSCACKNKILLAMIVIIDGRVASHLFRPQFYCSYTLDSNSNIVSILNKAGYLQSVDGTTGRPSQDHCISLEGTRQKVVMSG
jgi:hypothetical protein